ncbi:hypothetical protein OH492_20555 [Vibrio chagasii]|nr:hypothetical protein [Vibrio chagasii]
MRFLQSRFVNHWCTSIDYCWKRLPTTIYAKANCQTGYSSWPSMRASCLFRTCTVCVVKKLSALHHHCRCLGLKEWLEFEGMHSRYHRHLALRVTLFVELRIGVS